VPHPIAAGNRLEGRDCKGGACAIAVATRPQGAPLTGLPWRATRSEADEAPVPVRGVRGFVTSREKLRLCAGSAPDGVGELRMADRVCLLRLLVVSCPGHVSHDLLAAVLSCHDLARR
jgi:hypothetical protein